MTCDVNIALVSTTVKSLHVRVEVANLFGSQTFTTWVRRNSSVCAAADRICRQAYWELTDPHGERRRAARAGGSRAVAPRYRRDALAIARKLAKYAGGVNGI
jgi:hypothetical protein